MLSLSDALGQLLHGVQPVAERDRVPTASALGRVLAELVQA